MTCTTGWIYGPPWNSQDFNLKQFTTWQIEAKHLETMRAPESGSMYSQWPGWVAWRVPHRLFNHLQSVACLCEGRGTKETILTGCCVGCRTQPKIGQFTGPEPSLPLWYIWLMKRMSKCQSVHYFRGSWTPAKAEGPAFHLGFSVGFSQCWLPVTLWFLTVYCCSSCCLSGLHPSQLLWSSHLWVFFKFLSVTEQNWLKPREY